MMIKLPDVPKGARIEKLIFSQSGNFETNIRYYTGKEANNMRYAGEKKLFRYAETEDTSISISETEISYVRIESPDTLSLIPIRADSGSVTESVEFRQSIPVKNLKTDNQKENKSTVIYFENPDRRKISRIRAEFVEKKFRRTVLIYEQTDHNGRYVLNTTAVVEKGKERENDGILDVNFSGSRSRKLKMLIENGDNDPITLSKFEIISLSEMIIFALPEKFDSKESKIQVYYGNKYAQEPRFDIMSNYNKDSRVAEFSLEKESKNPDFGFTLLEPPVSTWIIRLTFFALLIILGWYASKALKLYLVPTVTAEK